MKVSLLTLGCKVNQAEVARMEGDLLARGHDLVELGDGPDLCIVNTCTVTGKSDYQSRQLIRRAARTGARVYVSGCYAELNREKVSGMEGVEKVINNDNKHNVISQFDNGGQSIALSHGRSRTRRFLKVQDGCNFSCSYCLIWKARGQSRSESPEVVVEEVEAAVREGVKEVALTGVHLGLYGKDLLQPESLSGLVEKILRETDIGRIRLSSLEVNEIDALLLDLLGDRRVCSHLHVPLQSGDDDVLRMMRRKYSVSYFISRIKEIQRRYPDIGLGTDIIAGFPQETPEAFANSLRVLAELPFTYAHVFPYSRRPGTEAAGLRELVEHTERRERAARLRSVAAGKKRAFLESQKGRVLSVLFEEELEGNRYKGTSDNYLRIESRADRGLKGNIFPVIIEDLNGGNLRGTLARSS
jgi:threonylcarbamoyladenosine tRNA methylthiotransferase MtaB